MAEGSVLITTHVLNDADRQMVAEAASAAGFRVRVDLDLRGDQIAEALVEDPDTHVLLTDELPRIDLPAPGLRWIQHTSTGLDRERVSPYWGRDGVTLTSSSGCSAITMAEHAIAVILYYEHAFDRYSTFQDSRDWSQRRGLRPHPVFGRTVGLLGYGGVGSRISAAAVALGMNVIAVRNDPNRPTDDLFGVTDGEHAASGAGGAGGAGASVRILGPDGLETMLKAADYLVIAAALTDETRGLIDEAALAVLKPGAILINVARGPIVDEAALIAALRSGHLRAAAVDVFDPEPLDPASPLFDVPNLMLSPHVSGAHDEMSPMVAALFLANLQRFVDGRNLYNVVRFDRGY